MTKNKYFKGTGSCIDLILTNRKYSFKHTESYETGLEIGKPNNPVKFYPYVEIKKLRLSPC